MVAVLYLFQEHLKSREQVHINTLALTQAENFKVLSADHCGKKRKYTFIDILRSSTFYRKRTVIIRPVITTDNSQARGV